MRSFTYSSVTSNAACAEETAAIAIDIRSCARLDTRYRKPLPSSPSRFSTGTCTSLKNSSAVSCACMPSLSRLRPRSKPAIPRSTTTSEIPRWRSEGSVFTAVITRSELMPLVMNVFAPFTT